MIRERVGDIWTTDCNHIVIPVNLAGPMGAGLAKQAKEKFPGVEYCWRSVERSPGRVYFYYPTSGTPDYTLVLIPTKYHWKYDSDLDLIKRGLRVFVGMFPSQSIVDSPTVAIPALGCGLGKLQWEDVQPVLHAVATLIGEDKVELWLPQPVAMPLLPV